MGLAFAESGHNDHARNGDAVGYLQIRPIVVRDVNRIYHTDFSMEDRWDRQKSITICELYLEHYCGPRASDTTYAWCWRGGPMCPANWPYWTQVKQYLDQVRLPVGVTARTPYKANLGRNTPKQRHPTGNRLSP